MAHETPKMGDLIEILAFGGCIFLSGDKRDKDCVLVLAPDGVKRILRYWAMGARKKQYIILSRFKDRIED